MSWVVPNGGPKRDCGVSTGHTCCSRGCTGRPRTPAASYRPLMVHLSQPPGGVEGEGYWFYSGGGGNGLSECIITAKKE
jgi:hypothetical protein